MVKNHTLRVLRIAAFGVTSFLAFVVVGLSGYIMYIAVIRAAVDHFPFAALGIATGFLTLLTLPSILTVSLIRKGAFTSMIVVDIAWTCFLWIMWFAVGASSATHPLVGNCSRIIKMGYLMTPKVSCIAASVVAGLGFLSWVLLISYNITLMTLSLKQHLRGNSDVWTQDVTETDFSGTTGKAIEVIDDFKATSTLESQYYSPQTGTPQVVYAQQVANPHPQLWQIVGQYPQHQVASPYILPQATGSFTPPQLASPYILPQDTGSFTPPQVVNPYILPQDTGSFTPPQVVNPYILPQATGSFTPPQTFTSPYPQLY